MYRYNTIASENDYAKLEGLVNDRTGEVMPQWIWLDFISIKSKEYPKQTVTWDNPDWIFGKFYKFLKRYILGECKKKDKEMFFDIWETLDKETAEDLKEMLDEAIKLGWRKEK